MDCSLRRLDGLIAAAIATLTAAIALAYFWPSAYPLLAAAALVAAVSFGLIPAIRNELIAYENCRGGPAEGCRIAREIDLLGQAASILSVVSFAVAGAMQIAALAFIASWFLSWIGVGMAAAVAALTYAGIASCGATILILIGLLTNAHAYANCRDRADAAAAGVSAGTAPLTAKDTTQKKP